MRVVEVLTASLWWGDRRVPLVGGHKGSSGRVTEGFAEGVTVPHGSPQAGILNPMRLDHLRPID